MPRFYKIITELLLLGVIALGQQGGTSSTSLNVQSTVQVIPAPPRYFVEVCTLSKLGKGCSKSVPLSQKKEGDTGQSDSAIKDQSTQKTEGSHGQSDSNATNQTLQKADCIPNFPPKPDDSKKSRPLNASEIVTLLGNPDPFSLEASGPDKILIYSKRFPPDSRILEQIKTKIKDLQDPQNIQHETKSSYFVELSIPHASALGDLATLVNSLGFSDFTVKNVGKDRVSITNSATPDCSALTTFYSDLRRAIWRPAPENPVYRVFFMNASDAAGSGGGSSGQAGQNSSSTAAPSSSTPTPMSSQGNSGNSQQSGGGTTTSITAGTAPSPSSSAGTAGGGVSSSNAKPSMNSGGAGGPGTGSGGNTSGTGGSSIASVAGTAVGNDFVIFSDALPGDDGAITARKRIISQLDLPRPEMIINVWVAQKSSTTAQDVVSSNNQLRGVVKNFNDALQDAVDRGWRSLKEQKAQVEQTPGNEFFDPAFRHYIGNREIAEDNSKPSGEEQVAQGFLRYEPSASIPDAIRKNQGLCQADRYCLGYGSLFSPLKPRLTDLLLAAMAAHDWHTVFATAINEIEGVPLKPCTDCAPFLDPTKASREVISSIENRRPEASSWQTCDERDRAIFEDWKRKEAARQCSFHAGQGDSSACNFTPTRLTLRFSPGMQNFALECFRDAVDRMRDDQQTPHPIDLARSAIADFLFHYKIAEQYPYDFAPYELSQSAQAFNSALAPLVDAFNRDLTNFQTALIDGFTNNSGTGDQRNWVGGEKPTFNNSGFITVRTISGIDTTANTTTQNFLDATQQPGIADLFKSITSAATSGKSTGTILQNISPIQAQVIMGVVNSVQSSKVQIGRGLNIDVTPRSLSGASSAEIAVTIKADESGAPTFFGGSLDSKNADLSRVAQHDTTTKVRVDSIKLFEVSTFTAELDKSRTRFPILPPFVEIPYLGSLIGWPLPRAKQYHSSVAVLSAVVVPTAADLAYGIAFSLDRVITSSNNPKPNCNTTWSQNESPLCAVRRAVSLSDLHGAPVFAFHKKMVQCLAYHGWRDEEGREHTCEELSFKSVTPDGSDDHWQNQ